jgi:hypothetical protein
VRGRIAAFKTARVTVLDVSRSGQIRWAMWRVEGRGT